MVNGTKAEPQSLAAALVRRTESQSNDGGSADIWLLTLTYGLTLSPPFAVPKAPQTPH